MTIFPEKGIIIINNDSFSSSYYNAEMNNSYIPYANI